MQKKYPAYLKISQAAKMLGFSIDTLRRWEKTGKISAIRDPKSNRLYHKEQLAELKSKIKVKVSSENHHLTSGQAANSLNVSIDTLRRWEKAGKITSERDSRGNRFYELAALQNINQSLPLDPIHTKELLNRATIKPLVLKVNAISSEATLVPANNLPETIVTAKNHSGLTLFKPRYILATLFFFIVAVPGLFLPYQYWKNQVNKLEEPKIVQASNAKSAVLAASISAPQLQINASTEIKGALKVADDINGLKFSAEENKISIASGNTTLAISRSITLDQDLAASSSPAFDNLTLTGDLSAANLKVTALTVPAVTFSGTTKQLITSSGNTITLPDKTDTLIGKTTTDTLSNKTIKSGDSNTISGSFPDITGITSLGTVSEGTWTGTKIAVGYGGTGLTSYTTGDLVYSSAANTLKALNIGTSGQILTISNGIPAWTSNLSGSSLSGTTINGLTITNNGTNTLNITAGKTLAISNTLTLAGTDSTTFTFPAGSGTITILDASQTLTNKTLTTPIISSISNTGTLTLPTATTTLIGRDTTDTLTNKTLTSPTIGTSPTAAGSTWTDLGTVTTVDINGGTLDGVTIGGSAAAGGTFTTLAATGGITVSPTGNSITALTLRATSGSGSPNILNITNAAGDSSYLSVSAAGALTVGGNTFTATGNLAAGGIIQLTGLDNAIVGTAIEGGWTMNSNTYTYRRTVTVTNNDGANALPANYEVTVSLSGSTASQIYTASQTDGDDLRVDYGGTEIARNITSFTSSSIIFTFQLQAEIAASGSDAANYKIYYGNSAVSAGSTYTGNIAIESADATTNWASADSSQFPLAIETSSPAPQEGTGSLKLTATVDNIGAFATTNQGQLSGARTNFGFASPTISGTRYLYVIGGSTDGTDANAQTTVLRTSVAAATGHVGSWTTNANSLSAGIIDNSVVVAASTIDGGTGSDGAIDLANGSGAGGCTGTGLSWNAGTSTCTIATATKSTFNFTTITIPVGTTLTTSGTTFPTINATGNVTIAGTVNLAEKGSSGGTGRANNSGLDGSGTGKGGGGIYSGCCSAFSGSGGGGAGFGGAGGLGGRSTFSDNNRGAAGITYDTTSMGSGGGGGAGGGSGTAGGNGGAGGGGIKISSSGTVTVSGTITANGSVGSVGNYCSGGGGGGSGGKIWLLGTNLTVSGTLTVNGGNGGNGGAKDNDVCWEQAPGGGGAGAGKITLEYSGTLNTTGSTITLSAGSAGTGYGTPAAGSSNTSSSAQASSVLFSTGGKNTSGAAQSAINYGTISSSDGSIGSFAASSTSLPQALFGHVSTVLTISSTNYLYIIGGNNGTTDQTTVYKGTFNSDGTIAAIATTSQTQLGTGISYPALANVSISSTNYLYVIGGLNGSTAQTSVYKGTVDGSGNITALTTTSQGTLPVALYGASAYVGTVGSNNYLYVIGGKTTGGTRQTVVYKASIDASGNIGTFTTDGQTQLTTATANHASFSFTDDSSNQYTYMIGGNTAASSGLTAVTKATYTPIDQTTYSVTKTLASSINMSNKNDIQFKVYTPASGGRTGQYLKFQVSEDNSTWRSCDNSGDFNASSVMNITASGSWQTIVCKTTGLTSTQKDALLYLKYIVNSSSSSQWILYIDDVDGIMNASTIDNTASGGSASMGAANLDLNAQGTGAVRFNYDGTNSMAGTGGLTLYNGGTTSLFSVSSAGSAALANISTSTTNAYAFSLGTLTGGTSTNYQITTGVLTSISSSTSFQANLGAVVGASSATFGAINTGAISGAGTTSYGLNLGANSSTATTNYGVNIGAISGAGTNNYGLYIGAISGAGTGNFALYTAGGKVQFTCTTDGTTWAVSQANPSCSDYAEVYDTNDYSLEAGDLIVIADENGKVAKSNSKYQKQLIGVYSTSPGMLIGGDGIVSAAGEEAVKSLPKGKVPVALAGRVPVKVSTESGAIKAGDYLTSASIPGVAMKAIHPGQVIGKALEDFSCQSSAIRQETNKSDDRRLMTDDCQGKILVFVNPSFADPNDALANLSLDENGNLTVSITSKDSSPTTNATEAAPTPLSIKDQIASLSARLFNLETLFRNDEASSSAIVLTELQASGSATLDLAPPELLFATGSARLADLAITSQATFSGQLVAYDLSVQNTFKSLGNTILSNTLVAGNFSVDGSLTLTQNSISTFGTLYIQNSPLAKGIDVFNGLVTIDNTGLLKAETIVTNKLIIPNTLGASTIDPTIGSGKIPTGQTSAVINNNQITKTAKIFITPRTKIGTQSLVVETIEEGKSFTVSMDHNISAEVTFDWWIVETRE